MARKLEVLFGGKQLQDTGTNTKKNIHYYAESYSVPQRNYTCLSCLIFENNFCEQEFSSKGENKNFLFTGSFRQLNRNSRGLKKIWKFQKRGRVMILKFQRDGRVEKIGISEGKGGKNVDAAYGSI